MLLFTNPKICVGAGNSGPYGDPDIPGVTGT